MPLVRDIPILNNLKNGASGRTLKQNFYSSKKGQFFPFYWNSLKIGVRSAKNIGKDVPIFQV